MEIAGYIASALIGISMGLIGGGGSILTIPILVYFFALSPTIAISYSLFVVGVTSLAGAFTYYLRGLISFATVLLFGSCSITTVFLTRRFIIPALPDVFFKIGDFNVTHALFVMVVFAFLMLAAAISMIKSKQVAAEKKTKEKPFVLVLYGILIGMVTGFLGAGGGFLLIPALVVLMKLPMKQAIGTSLLIISLNSLIGFTGDFGRHPIDWKLLIVITSIAIGGMYIGSYFNQRINNEKLKIGFGWFILIMGIFIIIKEIFF
jgi:uncharacterized membrane protein YfcA